MKKFLNVFTAKLFIMKNILLLLISLFSVQLLAQNHADYKESLKNGLSYGIDGDSTLAILGKPDFVGDKELRGATGNYYQEWIYSDIGLTLIMESISDTSTPIVHCMEITKNPSLCTSKGVCIGVSREFVVEQYKVCMNTNLSTNSIIVIGDLYKGLYIYIQDEIVVKMVLGFVAE